MAKVVITIKDTQDETVSISTESDPAWPTSKGAVLTTAQILGLRFLEWVNKRSSDD